MSKSSSGPPTAARLAQIGDELGLDLEAEEVAALTELSTMYMAAYDRVRELAEALVRPRRGVVARAPDSTVNRANGWVARCTIRGSAGGGLLSGKRLAVKDNICVDGVPMQVGSAIMEGFIPQTDAVVVERALSAGASIVGKTAVPGFCFDGASVTGVPEPQPVNPWSPEHCAGGSSGGNAVVLVNGEADIALGTDTAGSVRIPASWSGCCGFKPTYGLVPSSGIFPIEQTLDHVGAMARTVAECALLLDAVAGPEHGSLQQPLTPPLASSAELDAGVGGVRVGVLTEGFGIPGLSEPDVDDLVRTAARSLEVAGAGIVEISVPMHRDGVAIWAAILFEGATDQLFGGDGLGSNRRGRYAPELMSAFGTRRRDRGHDFPPTVKLTALIGRHMTESSHHRDYATAQNLAIVLQDAYSAALREVDVLVMPTTPMKACPLPRSQDPEEIIRIAWSNLQNTAPFNVAGNPALSIPCGFSGRLPVGAMIVGRHFDDALVLRVGHTLQRELEQGRR